MSGNHTKRRFGKAIQRVLVVSALLAGVAGNLWAESPRIHVDVKSGPAGTALLNLAEQAGVQITLPQQEGISKQLKAIKGEYTLANALDEMLDGSGLVYEFTSDESVVVKEGAEIGRERSSLEKRRELEEVIVTAQKRAESVQDIPIAISALSAEEMDRASVTMLHDLKKLAPSLQFGNRGAPNISLRGVGQQTRDIGAESGVQISENGMPLANIFLFDSQFLDLERVEVLRGPQGTISGRNATGGAINVYSKLPTKDLEGGIKATVGSFNRFATEGHLSGPILEGNLLSRFAFRTNRADGWLDNTFLDEKVHEVNETQARASFLSQVNDDFEALLVLEAQITRGFIDQLDPETGRLRPDTPSISENAGVSPSDLEGLKVQFDRSSSHEAETYKAVAKLRWDLSPNANLTSTSGYARYDGELSEVDLDGSAADGGLFPFIGFRHWQISQELTFIADLNNKLDMILGALYLHSESEEPLDIAFPAFGIPAGALLLLPEQESDSYAIYTQWRYRMTDNLRVTLGGRYTHDSKNYFEKDVFFGVSATKGGTESWGVFTPRIAIDYIPADDLTFYTSISRGYKAGGFNTYGDLGGQPDEFDPEFVWNYEAGVKAKWFDQRLRTELSTFYMEYTDYQASITRPIGLGGTPVLQIENAAEATIEGFELELEGQLTDKLKFVVSGTWLDAAFDKMESADPVFPEFNDPDTGLRNLEGSRIPRAPKWQFNVSGEYVQPVVGSELLMVLRADYQWQDKLFFDIFNNETLSQGSYGLLNFYTALETDDGRWQLAAFGNNILDERYLVDEIPFAPSTLGNLGKPRTYGLSFLYKF